MEESRYMPKRNFSNELGASQYGGQECYPEGGGEGEDTGKQRVVPKKHWLKVLPPIEEYNKRLQFQQKEAAPPVAPQKPARTQLRDPPELTPLRPNKRAPIVPRALQFSQGRSQQFEAPQRPSLETQVRPSDPQAFKSGNVTASTSPQDWDFLRLDTFLGSERVVELTDSTFRQAINDKDVALVLFYNKYSAMSCWSTSHFIKAAETTNRANHMYASVDCSRDSVNQICQIEGATNLPFFKIYSRGVVVGTVQNPKEFTSDVMKNTVETQPVRTN